MSETALFENREISWLHFNKRVLFQALDKRTPILERLKFLSIYGSNLDEFFSVRVGAALDRTLVEDMLDLESQSDVITQIIDWLADFDPEVKHVHTVLLKELKAVGIEFANVKKAEKDHARIIKEFWNHQIKPFLSPQIILANHPFPFLTNQKEYFMVTMIAKSKKLRYGLIAMDHLNPYFYYHLNHKLYIVRTRDIIEHFVADLFAKEKIHEMVTLRVTRNADIDVEMSLLDEDMDYREVMSDLINKRPLLGLVRLQLDRKISDGFVKYLQVKLDCKPELVVINKYPLSLSGGFTLYNRLSEEFREHCYEPQESIKAIDFTNERIMDTIKKHDILLAYPYHSSRQFIQLLYEAATNPLVESIKITLYRVANPSRIIEALVYAAEKGKQVTTVLELRARFDESRNINYSKILEEAGCTIIYGIPNYKVHCKVCVIKMKNQYITYIGTGNFNEKTQRQYTDLALVTTEQAVGEDAEMLFDHITRDELPTASQTLWIAPNIFRQQLVEAIEEEMTFGEHGRIIFKMNSFNDPLIMNKLIEASQAGVKIYLIIRGIACLVPGVPGYTDNITIKSIVGRYLEHSRIYAFGVLGRLKMYIGSGDLLNRNTQHRIEVFAKIKQYDLKVQLEKILQVELYDKAEGWIKQSDGNYYRVKGEDLKHSQDILYDYFKRKPQL